METGDTTPATWSRRDVGRAFTALAGGMLLAGCQPQRPSIATATTLGGGIQAPGAAAPADIQALLDRRAQALLNGDEQAWLADLDQNNQDLMQLERMRFANLTQLELKDFRFLPPRTLPGGAGVQEYSPVLQVTQLSVDDGPGGVAPAEAFTYTVTSTNGTPVVSNVVPLDGAAVSAQFNQPAIAADAPWNTTPLRVLQAGNVWLAGDDSVPDLETFAAVAQAQVGSVEALWGDRIRFPGYLLFFTRNPANFVGWYGFGESENFTDPQRFEGFEYTLQGVRTNGQVYNGQYAGARIVVNLASAEFNGDQPEYVIRHELVHAVTSRAGRVSISLGDWLRDTPRWAVEGFARWVENLDNPSRQEQVRALVVEGVRAGRFAGLPPPVFEEFYGADIGFNYAVGSTVFKFIDQTRGRDAAVEFYARVIQHSDSVGEPLANKPVFDAICQEVLGAGRDAFLQQWDAFVRGGA